MKVERQRKSKRNTGQREKSQRQREFRETDKEQMNIDAEGRQIERDKTDGDRAQGQTLMER